MDVYIPQDIQDMQENLPKSYQDWLDSQVPSINERNESLEALVAESKERDYAALQNN